MTPAQASLLDDAREIWPIGSEHLSDFENALISALIMRRETFGAHAVMSAAEEAVLDEAFVAMCAGIRAGFKPLPVAVLAALPAVSWAQPAIRKYVDALHCMAGADARRQAERA
jgi:hypothetical protein